MHYCSRSYFLCFLLCCQTQWCHRGLLTTIIIITIIINCLSLQREDWRVLVGVVCTTSSLFTLVCLKSVAVTKRFDLSTWKARPGMLAHHQLSGLTSGAQNRLEREPNMPTQQTCCYDHGKHSHVVSIDHCDVLSVKLFPFRDKISWVISKYTAHHITVG